MADISSRPPRFSRSTLLFYGVVIAAISGAFVWQMLHGICPVP
ncbi:MAG: hypothetical protein WBX15_08100 [Thermoanaerobaculia bacterium]